MRILHGRIVRLIYTRHINIMGWPTKRQRAVWWLYELYYRELWLDVADRIVKLNKATQAWIASIGFAKDQS